MILGGDEFLRTQRGNNNAYCQDNEISWFDWTPASRNADILEFFRKAIALTRRFPVLQRRKFFLGATSTTTRVPDLTWFGADLGQPPWHDPERANALLPARRRRGPARPSATRLFFILNAHWECSG